MHIALSLEKVSINKELALTTGLNSVHYNSVHLKIEPMEKSKRKNITLSADARLIALARRKAAEHDSTLNDEFRAWLEQFTRPTGSLKEYEELMASMKGLLTGERFSREKANER